MHVRLAIHRAKPEHEADVIEAMRRFGEAAVDVPGLRHIFALQDREQEILVGLAIWDSAEAADAARPRMRAAIAEARFDEWENAPQDFFELESLWSWDAAIRPHT